MKNYLSIFVLFVLLFPLTNSCQGVKNDGIDPVLLEHLKSIVDTEPECGKALQIYFIEGRDVYAYYITTWQFLEYWRFRVTDDLNEATIFPSDVVTYKNHSFFFYIEGKKTLTKEQIHEIIGFSPDSIIARDGNPWCWYYIKDKYSNKSAFTKYKYGKSESQHPVLRYFLEDPQDSALIDMEISDIRVSGKANREGNIVLANQLNACIEIFNKSDSILYIGFGSKEYGNFVIRNGKQQILLIPIHTPYGLHKISPHDYMFFSAKIPIQSILIDSSANNYIHKLYDLFIDSVYYEPNYSIQSLDSIQGYYWNKKFHLYYSPTSLYRFWTNDSICTIIYSDGTTNKKHLDRISKYQFFSP